MSTGDDLLGGIMNASVYTKILKEKMIPSLDASQERNRPTRQRS